MSATTPHAGGADPLAAAGLQGVPEAEDVAHYNAAAATLRAREGRREAREFLKTLALILAIPAIASGWVAREVMPEVRQTVEFVPLMPDGTIASAHRWENLPADIQGDSVVNTLWNYVRLRESYSSVGAEYAWRVVSALSEAPVREEYQRANDPTMAHSPYQRWGDKVRVDVSYDSHTDLCPMTGCKRGELPVGYQFRFLRTEIREGRASNPQFFTAQVRFRRGVEGIDPRQRFTFNGPAAQVTEYVPGTPAGAQPGVPRR